MADDISLRRMEIDPWLARATARRPEAVALETPEERLTYRELLMAATRAAARLVSRGAAPGGRGASRPRARGGGRPAGAAPPPPPFRRRLPRLPPAPPPRHAGRPAARRARAQGPA